MMVYMALFLKNGKHFQTPGEMVLRRLTASIQESGEGSIMGRNSKWTSGAALPLLIVPGEHRVTHVHFYMHLPVSSINC